MTLNDFPWLLTHYERLISPFLYERAHHGLLLQYVSGSAEETLVSTLAKRLLCQSSHTLNACEQCHSCKLFDANTHPDFYLIENDPNKHTISVMQVRNALEQIYEKSQQGGNKVIWIKCASMMTESASNALLKTLEEPPQDTYFILSDDHNKQLLPTIKSRCFSYFLPAASLDISLIWLKNQYKNYTDNELLTALLLNENAPVAASHMLEQKKWLQRKSFCDALALSFTNNDFWSLAKQIEIENCEQYLNWFCSLLIDALKLQHQSHHYIINRDNKNLIVFLANYDKNRLIQIYDIWCLSRSHLLTVMGLNKELIVYSMLAKTELCHVNLT